MDSTITTNCTIESAAYGLTDVFNSYPPFLLSFASFCFVLFITVGVPGNAITILALGRSKLVRNATAAFIINLSVADLFFCTFNLPLAVSNFANRGWVHGEFLCILSSFLRYGNVAVSLLTVMVITVNRFVMIVHPRAYPRIFRRTSIGAMIVAIWLVSFGPLLPTLAELWGRFGFDQRVGTCTIMVLNGHSPKVFLFVLAFVLPCIIICVCYARIYCVVHLSRTKARSHRQSRDFDVSDSSSSHRKTPTRLFGPSDPHSRAHSSTTKKTDMSRDLRLVKMILVIFGSFVFCNLPLTLVKVFWKEKDMPVLNTFGYVALYAAACTNPVIYVVMSREYRRAYLDLFTCGGEAATSASATAV